MIRSSVVASLLSRAALLLLETVHAQQAQKDTTVERADCSGNQDD